MTRRRLVVVLGTAAALTGAVAGVVLLAPVVVGTTGVQERLRAGLSRRLGRPVTFERLALGYDPLPVVRVTRLSVGSPKGFGADPFVQVDEVVLRLRLEPLRRWSLKLGELVLERPRFVVAQRAGGDWNVPARSALSTARAAPLALVSRVRLRDGRIEVRVPGLGERLADLPLERVEVGLDDVGRSAPIRVRLTAALAGGGVRFELAGTLGPLAAAGGDPAALPVQLSLRVDAEETAAPRGAAVWVRGTGGGAVRVDGRLGQLFGDGRLAFARVSLAHQPASCRLPASRTLVLENVELPVHIAGAALTVRPFAFRVADGAVRGEAVLTWHPARPDVQLSDVRIQGVTVERVLVDYLCHPFAVTGRLYGSGTLALAGVDPDWRRAIGGEWRLYLGPGRLVGPGALTLAEHLARAGPARSAAASRPPSVPLPPGPLDFARFAASGTVESGEIRAGEIRWTGSRTRIVGAGRYGLTDAHLDLRLAVETGRAAVDVSVVGPAWDPARLAIERAAPGSGRATEAVPGRSSRDPDPAQPTLERSSVLGSSWPMFGIALRDARERARGR